MTENIVPERKCSVEGCEKKHHCRGFCGKHYERFRRYGSPAKRNSPTGHPPGKPWSDDEVDVLRRMYSETPTTDLKNKYLPNRSLGAIRTKGRELGLRKTKEANVAAREHVYAARRGTDARELENWETRVCVNCGEHFEIAKYLIRGNQGRHCSHRCASDSKKKVFGEGHPLYSLVDVDCEWCGSGFKAKPSVVEKGDGRFCSRECVGAYTSSLQGGRRSSIEVAVEAELEKMGVDFVPQEKFGRFLVDFYLPSMNLVIECDGDYWHSRPEVVARDKRKNKWMERNGVNLARITESDIREDCASAVVRAIQDFREVA